MGVDPAKALGVLRSGVGVLSWVSPGASWQTFQLGSIHGDPRSAVVTRLFGVRELALGQAVLCPDPTVRRAALQAGIAIDSVDIVATLLALRKGAPKLISLTFAAGAAAGIALGVAALAREERPVVS